MFIGDRAIARRPSDRTVTRKYVTLGNRERIGQERPSCRSETHHLTGRISPRWPSAAQPGGQVLRGGAIVRRARAYPPENARSRPRRRHRHVEALARERVRQAIRVLDDSRNCRAAPPSLRMRPPDGSQHCRMCGRLAACKPAGPPRRSAARSVCRRRFRRSRPEPPVGVRPAAVLGGLSWRLSRGRLYRCGARRGLCRCLRRWRGRRRIDGRGALSVRV